MYFLPSKGLSTCVNSPAIHCPRSQIYSVFFTSFSISLHLSKLATNSYCTWCKDFEGTPKRSPPFRSSLSLICQSEHSRICILYCNSLLKANIRLSLYTATLPNSAHAPLCRPMISKVTPPCLIDLTSRIQSIVLN